MILYRGQAVAPTVGLWWTDDEDDALSFAMSRGGRSWIVLSIEVPYEWAARFLRFSRETGAKNNWYQIPPKAMREQWVSVQIHKGQVAVQAV